MSSDQQRVLDALDQLARDLDLAAVNIRRALNAPQAQGKPQTQPAGAAAPALENLFNGLKWDTIHSDKLGEYQIAGSPSNLGEQFQNAVNVLRAADATIKTRYHPAGYAHSYWLYGEGKIYRQKLKEP